MIALSVAIVVWALVALRVAELYFAERRLQRRPASEERLAALETQLSEFRAILNAQAARNMTRPR